MTEKPSYLKLVADNTELFENKKREASYRSELIVFLTNSVRNPLLNPMIAQLRPQLEDEIAYARLQLQSMTAEEMLKLSRSIDVGDSPATVMALCDEIARRSEKDDFSPRSELKKTAQ
jgi:hypothetical protein